MTLYILSGITYSISFCFTWRVLSHVSSVCLLGRNSLIPWQSLCVFAQEVPWITLYIVTLIANGSEYDFIFTTFKIIWLNTIWNRHFPSAVLLDSPLWPSQSRYISPSFPFFLSLTVLPPSQACHSPTLSAFFPSPFSFPFPF